MIGDFINNVLSFIFVAAAVYFFVVLPMNTIVARMRRGQAAPDHNESVSRMSEHRAHSGETLRVLHVGAGCSNIELV